MEGDGSYSSTRDPDLTAMAALENWDDIESETGEYNY